MTKVTQQVSGRDGIATQVFQRPEPVFLSRPLAKIPGGRLLLLLNSSSSPRKCWSGEEDEAALGNQAPGT